MVASPVPGQPGGMDDSRPATAAVAEDLAPGDPSRRLLLGWEPGQQAGYGRLGLGQVLLAAPQDGLKSGQLGPQGQVVAEANGLPLWVIEVINPDPDTRQRTVKVKVAAQYQPVLPDAPAGSPFIPVEFEGMQATPYVDASRCNGDGKSKCAARLAYSLKATGVRAPSRGITRPAPDHGKDAA